MSAYHLPWEADLGATLLEDDLVSFRVWAPRAQKLSVKILGDAATRTEPLERDEQGYFTATISGIGAGTKYLYSFADGSLRPDPASRYQPDGVHGPSQVIASDLYAWNDRLDRPSAR